MLPRAREVWRRSPAARLGLTAVTMAVVAEGAVLLLAPSEQGIPPLPVDAGAYFGPDEVARATDYRDGQRLLLLGGIGAQLLVVGRHVHRTLGSATHGVVHRATCPVAVVPVGRGGGPR